MGRPEQESPAYLSRRIAGLARVRSFGSSLGPVLVPSRARDGQGRIGGPSSIPSGGALPVAWFGLDNAQGLEGGGGSRVWPRPVCLGGGLSPVSPSAPRVQTAPYGLFNGLIWPKTGFASTASAQQRRHNFLPLPA